MEWPLVLALVRSGIQALSIASTHFARLHRSDALVHKLQGARLPLRAS